MSDVIGKNTVAEQIGIYYRMPTVADYLKFMERVSPGLTKVDRIKDSPLNAYCKSNCYITAPDAVFKRHLKDVLIGQSDSWEVVLKSDYDLMDAWLQMDRKDIVDADVSIGGDEESSRRGLSHLIDGPKLLILIAGVKSSRNKAMPEVFAETLTRRNQLNLPTWVVDQIDCPFIDGHISYSGQAWNIIKEWPRFTDKSNPMKVPSVDSVSAKVYTNTIGNTADRGHTTNLLDKGNEV
jgi:hypothetical protein